MSTYLGLLRACEGVLGRGSRWKWGVVLAVGVGGAVVEVVGAVLIFALLGLVAQPDGRFLLPVIGDLSTRFPAASPRDLKMAMAGLVGIFFLGRAGFAIARAYVRSRVSQNAGKDVALRLVRGYLAMPYVEHTQRNSAEMVRNAFDSSLRLVSQVVLPLVTLATEGMMVLALAIVMLAISPLATVTALAILVPVVLLLIRVVQPRLTVLGRRSQDARVGSLRSLQQALGGIREIKLLGREDHFTAVFAGHRVELARAQYVQATTTAIPRALIESALVLVLVALFMGTLLTGGDVERIAPALGMFAYVGLRLQGSLRGMADAANDLRSGQAVLEDLTSDLDALALQNQIEHRHGPSTAFSTSIEAKDLGFSYPSSDTPALTGVDLVIERGQFFGVCGPTGGGKSTLVDLLTGLLTPTSGELIVDGSPMIERVPWWQAQLGVVSQSVFLIDDTIRGNIAFGRSGEEIDDAAVQRAASRAQLDLFLADLPDGLDTPVGERGVKLSGGQRQRVAIARALYREPDVLFFDEGTSALDTATEAALVKALDELKSGRTLIAVAHRISTVRHADKIVVVDGGRIVDVGSFDELRERSQLFRSLSNE